MNEQIEKIQGAMRGLGVEAWLFYNFRDTNPVACKILGFPDNVHQTRRWVCLIPADGEPTGLVHRIESHLAELLPGTTLWYSSQKEFEQSLKEMVFATDVVAMEYSPNNALPVVAKVDAGTVELVRSFGTEVISSGALIAGLGGQLDDEQVESARRAGSAVREMMMNAFGFIRDKVWKGETVTEYDVVRAIVGEIEGRGMVFDHSPICGVGANSANPHYSPSEEGALPIGEGDFVLVDLWAREREGRSVFGDITWVGYVGETVPDRYEETFAVVRDARNAAYRLVTNVFAEGGTVSGAALDDAAREVIRKAGYAEQFVHRTGHSITHELHGAGTNLDNFETEDTRPILPGTSFSIEPGIYHAGDFGIRSELDVVITNEGKVLAPSEPLQERVLPILGSWN